MPKQEGQKSKLLALLRIFEQQTDENHLLNVPQLVELLEAQGIRCERKSVYLGFSHLHSFLSSIFGFGLAGILLTKYCPDPALFETRAAWEAASANAHYIWYYFAAIGLIAAVALLLFAKITESIDKKKESSR